MENLYADIGTQRGKQGVSCAFSWGGGENPAELRDTHSWRPSLMVLHVHIITIALNWITKAVLWQLLVVHSTLLLICSWRASFCHENHTVCWAPWISQVISPGHPYFLEPAQYFQMLNLLPFFSGYLCEDDDQGGRNVFWTPWIRAGLNLFWKIQGSENSVTQLYRYTCQPPETKNLESLEIFCIVRMSFLTMSELYSPKITRRTSKCFRHW